MRIFSAIGHFIESGLIWSKRASTAGAGRQGRYVTAPGQEARCRHRPSRPGRRGRSPESPVSWRFHHGQDSERPAQERRRSAIPSFSEKPMLDGFRNRIDDQELRRPVALFRACATIGRPPGTLSLAAVGPCAKCAPKPRHAEKRLPSSFSSRLIGFSFPRRLYWRLAFRTAGHLVPSVA